MSADDKLAALDEALLADDDPDYDAEPTAPLDRNVAVARLGRLGALQRELDEAVAAADYRRAQIDAFVDRQRERLGAQMRWLEESLRRWHEMAVARDPKLLTVHLPTGDLTSRMGQAQWEIDDEPALLAWLVEHHPEAVRQKPPTVHPPEVDRNALKQTLVKHVDRKTKVYGVDPETMERPPGLTVTDPVREYVATPLSAVDAADAEAEFLSGEAS